MILSLLEEKPMDPTGATANMATAIWSRMLDAGCDTWSPDTARGILSIKLSAADRERMSELAVKIREQALTPDEEIEIESYRQVTRLLELMKAKARVSLKRAGLAP
jgi:hypothetical protein